MEVEVLGINGPIAFKPKIFSDQDLSRGLMWNDPEIGIEWPEHPEEISEQDQNNQSWSAYVNDLDTWRNRNAGDSVLSPSE
jgi:dTDP-4-dehydrorhamnose 3,5-epimerase-like enzyme